MNEAQRSADQVTRGKKVDTAADKRAAERVAEQSRNTAKATKKLADKLSQGWPFKTHPFVYNEGWDMADMIEKAIPLIKQAAAQAYGWRLTDTEAARMARPFLQPVLPVTRESLTGVIDACPQDRGEG